MTELVQVLKVKLDRMSNHVDKMRQTTYKPAILFDTLDDFIKEMLIIQSTCKDDIVKQRKLEHLQHLQEKHQMGLK